MKDHVASLAIVPISRRGDCIGAVAVATNEPREFTSADLERIEAMGDLVSVSMENAELVETLRQAEWRFRALFRAAPDAVLTLVEGGYIGEANDAVREITGVDPLYVSGRPISDFIVEGDRDRLQAALDATFAGTPTRVEAAFQIEADGPVTRRIVALAMTRLPEADPPSVLVVGRDITSDREMRGRLMESDRLAAVGELVAGVAHEVNNPLSSISAFAQLLLRDGGLTPAQRELVDVIKSETQRASQVVKDLLAFARRSEALREPLDLNGVLSRTLRMRGYQLTSNKIQLETDLAPDLPAVFGDARQLQQVFLNLVTNAIQAMVTLGGGTLFVTTRHEEPEIIVEVRDTGPGIPDSARAHIFEPFFTTKGEGEGTGLGLSVSYGIVTAHGGTVEVADTSTAGTTFRVSLPAADDAVLDQPLGEASMIAKRSLIAGIRLLFIDDEPSLAIGDAVVRRPARVPGADGRQRARRARDGAYVTDRRHRVRPANAGDGRLGVPRAAAAGSAWTGGADGVHYRRRSCGRRTCVVASTARPHQAVHVRQARGDPRRVDARHAGGDVGRMALSQSDFDARRCRLSFRTRRSSCESKSRRRFAGSHSRSPRWRSSPASCCGSIAFSSSRTR